MPLYEDIEAFVKEAMLSDDEELETTDTQQVDDQELVDKLAESVEHLEVEGNSRLGVAKLLMATDILAN